MIKIMFEIWKILIFCVNDPQSHDIHIFDNNTLRKSHFNKLSQFQYIFFIFFYYCNGP